MVRNAIRRTAGDLIFDAVNITILLFCTFIVIYPLYLIVIASISDPYAVTRAEVLFIPKDFSVIGYEKLLAYPTIWGAYRNSIVYTAAGTVIKIFLTMMAGYVLSRKFPGKKFLNIYFIFVMFFSGGLIPTFLQLRNLGLYDNPLIMVLMGAVSVWQVMIARTFIKNSIPEELYEACVMDGCNQFQYFFRFIIPLSKALIGVLAVMYAVGIWNDFMTALIYLRSRIYYPFQLVLREILASLRAAATLEEIVGENVSRSGEAMRIAESVKYSSIVISTVPVLILYLCLQKYFVKGVMIGSLKG